MHTIKHIRYSLFAFNFYTGMFFRGWSFVCLYVEVGKQYCEYDCLGDGEIEEEPLKSGDIPKNGEVDVHGEHDEKLRLEPQQLQW